MTRSLNALDRRKRAKALPCVALKSDMGGPSEGTTEGPLRGEP